MKFIVYLTTNIVNNKIYVGVHRTENPDVFDGYLGCGTNINNSHSYNRAKAPFHYAIIKYGVDNFKRATLRVFDTLEEALLLEAEIVNKEFISRKDTYNVALGGGVPPLTNKVIYQYDINGNFIKEWNSIKEAEDSLGYCGNNLSVAIKCKNPSKNFYWTDFKVNLLDTTGFSDPKKTQIIYHYTEKGEYIQTFDNPTIAAKYFNTTTSDIQRSVKGAYKMRGDYLSDQLYSIFKAPEKVSMKNTNLHKYDLEGKYIESYDSIKEVEKEFGSGCSSGILSSIRLGRAYKDFQWSVDKLDEMKKLIPDKPKKRKVGQYSVEGELIKEFPTVTAAKKEFGNGVDSVLKGRTKQTKGFIFKYLN